MPNTHSTLGALFSDIADSIRAKDGTSASIVADNFPSRISAIPTKEDAEWHQCPTAVKNYLDNVTYDPSDYTVSSIATYAPATAVSSNTKPVGKTIDGVTYYNVIPNVKTPFASTNKAGTVKPLDTLRWINSVTTNFRDLGGWSADGGTVKYGMLFRGGEPSASDKTLANSLGIKHELQLRGTAEAPQQYSLWDIGFTCPTNYVWMSISDKTTWKEILRCVIDNVTHGKPVYFHCAAGADRTGTVAVMLEGLLGMSQSDIDKDYELTCFSTGTGTDAQARRRNENEYKDYIASIVTLTGATFRDKCVNFAASCGITAAEINAFRTAMIDGTPSTVTPSIATYSVTKTLSHTTVSGGNTATQYQPFEADVSVDSGYVISDVLITMGGNTINAFTGEKVNLFRRVTNTLAHCTSNNDKLGCIDGQGYGATITADTGYTLEGGTVSITMGGVDVSNYYSNGKIAIPQVTGDIAINITAVAQGPSYTNIWATPYALNKRLNTSETDPAQNGAFISAWFPITASQMAGDLVLRSNKDIFNYTARATGGDYFRMYPSAVAGGNLIGQVTLDGPGITRTYDSTTGIYTLIIPNSVFANYISQIHYFRWCAQVVTGAAVSSSFFDGCILTVNEPIA